MENCIIYASVSPTGSVLESQRWKGLPALLGRPPSSQSVAGHPPPEAPQDGAASLRLLLASLSFLMSPLLPLLSKLGRTCLLCRKKGKVGVMEMSMCRGTRRPGLVPAPPHAPSGALCSAPPPLDPLLQHGGQRDLFQGCHRDNDRRERMEGPMSARSQHWAVCGQL